MPHPEYERAELVHLAGGQVRVTIPHARKQPVMGFNVSEDRHNPLPHIGPSATTLN
jgi:hypothetical protein